MSPTKLSLAGNNSRLGTGKSLTFFYSVGIMFGGSAVSTNFWSMERERERKMSGLWDYGFRGK